MNIEDLIVLLNNRLREFKLSKNYAAMSGDLERVNTADTEIIALEDTLFKLNLLLDTSKSAAVIETTLAEVITDGSVAVLGEYDITPYATDPLHEEKIMNILTKMGVMDTAEKIDNYIKGKYVSSPVTGEMVMSAASAYSVDARLMMAIMEQDSSFGTAGKAVRTLNPGNVGNDDSGNTRTYESWQEGVTAVAAWLSRHRTSQQIPVETVIDPIVTSTPIITSTSTPEIVPPTTTSTPVITPEIVPVTSTPSTTSTPETITETVPTTSTPPIITTTTTPETTPETLPTTPTSTPETVPPTTTTTTPTE